MLDKNSPIVKQQIKEGILDLSTIEYALALTSNNKDLNKADPRFGITTTCIVDKRWHSKISPVKASRTEHLKTDAQVLAKFQHQLDTDDFHDTQGAAGPETFCPASFWREATKHIIQEMESRRWFIVYHDDKYVYDYETNQPIKLDQTPWCLTDLTIFN